jgi:hypothetical protein
MIVGSGVPLGPNGPRKKAQAMTASMIAAAKMASFHAASGTKGRPVFAVSS